MKKLMKSIGALIFASIMLTSCGNSIEGDASRLAKLICQSTELSKQVASGDMSGIKDSQKMMVELAELKEEFDTRYKNKKAKEEFEKAVAKAISESNCN